MRRLPLALLCCVAVLLTACSLLPGRPAAARAKPASAAKSKPGSTVQAKAGGVTTSKYLHALFTSSLYSGPTTNLAPGSNPHVLPSPVLIADKHNNRLLIVSPTGKLLWEFPQPGNLLPGQSFYNDDDAFFTPNGRDIIATEEGGYAIQVISIRRHRIIYTYGKPGVPGSGPNRLNVPDDALMMPNGDIITADIRNCNILIIPNGQHVPLYTIGITDPYCYHNPPQRFASPNGAFPMTNGNYLVTEINGDWVDEVNIKTGQVLWSTHPPGVTYPSDTNEVRPGVYLTVGYTKPGQIVEFNRYGQLLWRFAPAGSNSLNKPSICMPIPTNGYILCTDDHNNRVIVVDPKTNKIVWQYGHRGVPGAGPGYLRTPDGLDLAPPYSFLIQHASTMGLPSSTPPASGVLG